MMKEIYALLALAGLYGCANSREIAVIKHADGSGETRYKYIAAGGIIRPGVIVVVAETIGSNAPVVLTQASGSPILPSVVQMSGVVGAAAALGGTLKPDETHNSSTTVIQDGGARSIAPGPSGPPGPPGPPGPGGSRPPFGPPPWHSSNPQNKGH